MSTNPSMQCRHRNRRVFALGMCQSCYNKFLREKHTGEATATKIKFICDHCGRLNEIEGSYDRETFNLRLRYAQCKDCGHERNAMQIESGCFRCARCRVVYRIRKHWKPVKGLCMACYMGLYRRKKKTAV